MEHIEIKRVLKLFKKLLPIYSRVYKNGGKYDLRNHNLYNGLCHAASANFEDSSLYGVFDGHYRYVPRDPNDKHYLFPTPHKPNDEGVSKRIEFLKVEIEALQKLIDRGYTHIQTS